MKRSIYFIPAPVLLTVFICLASHGRPDLSEVLGPCGLQQVPAHPHQCFIVQQLARRIDEYDLKRKTILRSLHLPEQPNNILVSQDGSGLLVSMGMEDGWLYQCSIRNLKPLKKLPVGHWPGQILETEAEYLVLHPFAGTLSFVSKDSFALSGTVPLGREPVSMAICPENGDLYIAHHLPEMAATADHVAARITVLDLATRRVRKEIPLPNGSTGVRDIALGPDGKYMLVTHILARFQLPTTQLERGWMNTNALTLIEMKGERVFSTLLLDDIDHGAANPWAIVSNHENKEVYISHAGTHELSVLDWPPLIAAMTRAGRDGQALSENLGFLHPYRTRVKLRGNGPRSMLLTPDKLVIAHYFSDDLSCIDLNSNEEQRITLGRAEPGPERLGEMYFNDGSLCFQHWQSCASCHPGSRMDGLNWDLLNDGIGNPKNTKSLLLSHQTPPVMSLGVRERAEVAVRAGFRYIQFAAVPEAYCEKVDAYLGSMQALPSPFQKDSAAIRDGAALFGALGCQQCHPAPLYTNLKSYATGEDPSQAWDTPTLVELWRSAPYWHDGRYASIEEIFTSARHGLDSGLSAKELADLSTFLRSL